MKLYYCEFCGLRIKNEDLSAGRARYVDEHEARCPDCNLKLARASSRTHNACSRKTPAHNLALKSATIMPSLSSARTRTRTVSNRTHLIVSGMLAAAAALIAATQLIKPAQYTSGTALQQHATGNFTEKRTIKAASAPDKLEQIRLSDAPQVNATGISTPQELDDPREAYAQRYWKELNAINAEPIKTQKIREFAANYGKTKAGIEAAAYIKNTDLTPAKSPAPKQDLAVTRSRSSGGKTVLRLKNNSEDPVTMYWVNYSGERINYGNVRSLQTKEISTYAGHVWLLSDAAGNDLGVCEATSEALEAEISRNYELKRTTRFLDSDVPRY